MFVVPLILFGVGITTVVGGVVVSPPGSLLLLTPLVLAQRFDLFPHLSKCSLEVFNTFKRMLVGIFGVGTSGTTSLLRAVCIPLSALCSVMRIFDAGRMHSAKLTKLLSANCLIARWAFKPDLASSAPNSEQQRAG